MFYGINWGFKMQKHKNFIFFIELIKVSKMQTHKTRNMLDY